MHADVAPMSDAIGLGDVAEPSAKSPPPAPPRADAPPACATAELLADAPDFSAAREARRFATGLGLAAAYGLALGARSGGRALFVHAAVVPSALVAVAALGVPALYIALGLVDAPIDHAHVVTASARAAARTGLVLAGLAPAAALFVVTSAEPGAAALAATAGLFVAGAIGLRSLRLEITGALADAPARTRTAAAALTIGFGVFAMALAARIWTSALPLLGGMR
jgi:hypothetical protein